MIPPMNLWHYELETPIGPMWAAFEGSGCLRKLAFGGLDPQATAPLAPKAQREAFRFLLRQIEAYFQGNLRTFTVPLALEGTPFQVKVWESLQFIPYGATVTYHDIAVDLGMPEGAQAVGGAVAANPILILVPCHRVIGRDGSLHGYAGGTSRKTFLLHLERGLPPPIQPGLEFE